MCLLSPDSNPPAVVTPPQDPGALGLRRSPGATQRSPTASDRLPQWYYNTEDRRSYGGFKVSLNFGSPELKI